MSSAARGSHSSCATSAARIFVCSQTKRSCPSKRITLVRNTESRNLATGPWPAGSGRLREQPGEDRSSPATERDPPQSPRRHPESAASTHTATTAYGTGNQCRERAHTANTPSITMSKKALITEASAHRPLRCPSRSRRSPGRKTPRPPRARSQAETRRRCATESRRVAE